MTGGRLKVFQAQFGFYDTVVAAPSRSAALRAWGVRQDLFASGNARLVTDKAAVAAAVAHPETPLRRPVGSHDPFELEPSRLPRVPHAPNGAVAKPVKEKQSTPPPRPIADRSLLTAAEAAALKLDQRHKREEADLRLEELALEARKAEVRAAHAKARTAATRAVVTARETYRKAGGID